MNKLYFGDNLEIMREMNTGAIDLICLDPPFNSNTETFVWRVNLTEPTETLSSRRIQTWL